MQIIDNSVKLVLKKSLFLQEILQKQKKWLRTELLQ